MKGLCMPINSTVAARFWAKVDRKSPDECWPWLASRVPDGYGQIKIAGKMLKAHRVAYVLTFGDIGDLKVLHSCDNPPCCNPAHLFKGTTADNNRDKAEKGRCVIFKGSEHPLARLSPEQVQVVRDDPRPSKELARALGVSYILVWRIRSGRTYIQE
jgi:hypothetical protein